MFYSPEGINQQSHSSPCYYPSTPESTPGWNSLVKFHFFAPFFILSIFQSPTWQKHNSLAGSGEMLRRGGGTSPSRRPRRLLPEALPFAQKFIWYLSIFSPPYLVAGSPPRMLHTLSRGTIRMRWARTFLFLLSEFSRRAVRVPSYIASTSARLTGLIGV